MYFWLCKILLSRWCVHDTLSSDIILPIYYSSLGNCRRPTLIQNGPQIGSATLKNCTTLISSAPRRDVCDAEKFARSAEIFFIYRYFQRKMKDFWRFSVVSKVLYFSLKINLWKCMMLGPTLIRSLHRIVRSTLKNFTTLIQFLLRREVVDAYLRRRQLRSGE